MKVLLACALAATWITPDVVRATARMVQLTERLPDATTVIGGHDTGELTCHRGQKRRV